MKNVGKGLPTYGVVSDVVGRHSHAAGIEKDVGKGLPSRDEKRRQRVADLRTGGCTMPWMNKKRRAAFPCRRDEPTEFDGASAKGCRAEMKSVGKGLPTYGVVSNVVGRHSHAAGIEGVAVRDMSSRGTIFLE